MPSLFARAARGFLIAATLAVAAAGPSGAASLAGAYLAGMQADARNDYAQAARYYGEALSRDPENLAIAQNAALARVALGDIDAAAVLADRLVSAIPGSPIGVLVQLADALATADFDRAEAVAGRTGPDANPLLTGLVAGWIEAGRDDFAAARARFDAMTANEALAAYGQYHKALALALAGDFIAAEAILAGGENGEPLHLSRAALIAHAEILAQIDRTDEAVALLDGALASGFPDVTLIDLRDRLARGDEVAFARVARAEDGAAEAFLTLAEALNAPDSDRLALLYARLAAHIRPDLIEARLLAAEVLERQEQYGLATEALDGVPPESPWFVTAEIRRATTQRAAGEPEAGIATLAALANQRSDLVEVHSAHGDALRVAERYEEAAGAYGRAIDLVGTPQPLHWILYYTRAISHERAGNWPPAEADFRQALALQPDQPMVLNYLGYSLVEQRRDLDEALDMIKRAVAGQPDDGYITDSLGWVYYRLGRYDEAVPQMLRAVELAPVDAVINDHLGDVLWKVGREREARFQWRRALSFGPADDLDMDRVRRKLEVGLDVVLDEEAAANDG